MKIGLLADIHGNVCALEAALGVLRDADILICAGDLVGYYPFANEVCTLIREKKVICIRGNHDAMFSGLIPCEKKAWQAYRFDYLEKIIKDENRKWLAELPVKMELHVDALKIIIRHASPWDEITYLYQDSDAIKKICLEKNELLCVGHTHRRMDQSAGRGRIINPGSVGLPRDGRGVGSVLLYDTVTANAEFIDINIDLRLLTKKFERHNWDKDLLDRWQK
jgi:putative phosphoesterase